MLKRIALVTLLAVAFSVSSEATTVRAIDDGELYRLADGVFHGVCTEVQLEQDARGRPVTRYRFQVKEGFKGTPGTFTDLLQPGGTFAGRTLVIAGAATFALGEEVVVFRGKPSPRTGCAFTVGLAQGKFHVDRRAHPVVERDLRGLQFVAGAPALEARPLEAFLSALRERRR